jgi:hypothetical protein
MKVIIQRLFRKLTSEDVMRRQLENAQVLSLEHAAGQRASRRARAHVPAARQAPRRRTSEAAVMNKADLVKAIKTSYRRLEYGANPIRIEQEMDLLIDLLADRVPVEQPATPQPAGPIPRERLLELLVQAGQEVGVMPQRLPPGLVRFAELVEAEVRRSM